MIEGVMQGGCTWCRSFPAVSLCSGRDFPETSTHGPGSGRPVLVGLRSEQLFVKRPCIGFRHLNGIAAS